MAWEPKNISDKALEIGLPDRLIVFDGVCNLCNGWVRFIIDRDPDRKFFFTPAQSSLGESLMRSVGIDVTDYDSNIYIENGVAFLKMDTVTKILWQMGALWPLVRAINIAPRPVRNWVYDRVAQNRYNICGRTERCMVPTAETRSRFLK